jgi:hypothetical protein
VRSPRGRSVPTLPHCRHLVFLGILLAAGSTRRRNRCAPPRGQSVLTLETPGVPTAREAGLTTGAAGQYNTAYRFCQRTSLRGRTYHGSAPLVDLPPGQDLPQEKVGSVPTHSKLQALAFLGKCAHTFPGQGCASRTDHVYQRKQLQAPTVPHEPYAGGQGSRHGGVSSPQRDRKCTVTSNSGGTYSLRGRTHLKEHAGV